MRERKGKEIVMDNVIQIEIGKCEIPCYEQIIDGTSYTLIFINHKAGLAFYQKS